MAIREKDGGYYVEVFLSNDPITGKKIRKTKTFKPKSRENLKLAKMWEIEIMQQFESEEFKGSMLLKDYLEYWMETYIIPSTKYQTYKRYETLSKCISDGLGHLSLDKIKTPHIDKFYNELKKETITLKNGTVKRRYMDGTILKVHKVFKQAMHKAVGLEMINRNPVEFATAPKDDERKIESWSIEEITDFLEVVKDTKIYLPCLIAFHTGMREGEICALRWEDIDIDKGIININHNMIEKKGIGLVLEPPKTESSKATVVMTSALKSILEKELIEKKKHKLKTRIDLEYICSWEDGRPLRPNYVSKTFKKFVDRSDLKKITFHGLRHSHATILYEAGANSQEISKRLRHSRVSTTDDIYIHVKEDIKKSTADIFDKAIESIK